MTYTKERNLSYRGEQCQLLTIGASILSLLKSLPHNSTFLLFDTNIDVWIFTAVTLARLRAQNRSGWPQRGLIFNPSYQIWLFGGQHSELGGPACHLRYRFLFQSKLLKIRILLTMITLRCSL